MRLFSFNIFSMFEAGVPGPSLPADRITRVGGDTGKSRYESYLSKEAKGITDCILTMRSVSFLSTFSDEELRRVEKCLSVRRQTYKKTEKIFTAGEPARLMGVVLAGRVHVGDSDAFGNRSILAELHPGDVLAAGYVCAQMPCYLATYTAAERPGETHRLFFILCPG